MPSTGNHLHYAEEGYGAFSASSKIEGHEITIKPGKEVKKKPKPKKTKMAKKIRKAS